MVYKVESRLGINRNCDRYTVLNWTKSGIESLYNNSHTIYTVVFSVLLLFFYFFFFFQAQWADQFHISAPTPGYFALRKEIIEIDLLALRTSIHVCGSSKFIFISNKGKRMKSSIDFGNDLPNDWDRMILRNSNSL